MGIAAPEDTTLRRALKLRHLVMLSVGGTIASGFLLASGGAIKLAGPAVVIVYIVAGLVSIGVMACLAELSVHGKTASGFAKFAEETMGPLMGFLTGSNYWLAWVAGPAGEAIAVGTFAVALAPFSSIPIWVISLVVIVGDLAINFIGVLLMGNYEFVLSTIKIIGMIFFCIFCFAAVFGVGQPAIGAANLTGHGGFFALGATGMFTSFLLVFYAYTGIELVSVSAEESVHPERDVPRALMLTAALVSALFIVSALALVSAENWQKLGVSSSPLIDTLNTIHLPVVANILTVAIIVASISGIDAGIYTGSRMLFALSRDHYLPARFAITNPRRKIPTFALSVTGGAMVAMVLLDLYSPTVAYVFLGSLSTLGFLWAWLFIPVMQMLYRRKIGPEGVRNLKWKTPLYPFTPIACIVLVATAMIAPIFQNQPGLFGINAGALPVVGGGLWMAIWIIYYFAYGKNLRLRGAAERSQR